MSNGARLSWYYYRLRSMSPGEVAWRCAEVVVRRRNVASPPSWEECEPRPSADLASAVLDIADLDAGATVERLAEELTTGELTLLCQQWPKFQGVPDWLVDPVTGAQWSTGDCFRIPFRLESGQDLGDVKFVWELNRLSWLVPVATHARRRSDQALAREVGELVRSWSAANPCGQTISWSSAIECAVRALAVYAVYCLLHEHWDDATKRHVGALLKQHAEWIRRNPSHGSSANNHRTAELAALVVLAEAVPTWNTTAKTTSWQAELQQQYRAMFNADGLCAEQAISYGLFNLELFTYAQRATNSLLGFEPPVAEVLHAHAWFEDSKGNRPRIGDEDGATVVLANVPETLYLPALAVLSGRPYEPAPAHGTRHFRDTGYSVFRRDVCDVGDLLLVFDHGPLGYGALAAHGHADALSIWLHVGGQPVFVDAGTYLYHGAGLWRDRLRSTAAHNTVTVEDWDQSEITGSFMWHTKHRAKTTLIAVDEESVTAAHDGYVARGVSVCRSIRVAGTSEFVVEVSDHCQGLGSRAATTRLLLDERVSADASSGPTEISWGTGRMILDGTKYAVTPGPKSAEAPMYAPRFGQIRPTSQLVAHLVDGRAQGRFTIRPER